MNNATCFISGVWKTGNTITHVLAHENSPNGFQPGIKIYLWALKQLLKEGKIVCMIEWNYAKDVWVITPPLMLTTIYGKEMVVCSDVNCQLKLERLIDMSFAPGRTFDKQSLIRTREVKSKI